MSDVDDLVRSLVQNARIQRIKKLERLIDAMGAELEAEQAKNKALEKQITEVCNHNEEQANAISNRDAQIADLEEMVVSGSKKEIDAKNFRIAELEGRVEGAHNRIAALEFGLDESQRRYRAMGAEKNRQLNEARDELARIKNVLGELL